jgi:hypothetical protein
MWATVPLLRSPQTYLMELASTLPCATWSDALRAVGRPLSSSLDKPKSQTGPAIIMARSADLAVQARPRAFQTESESRDVSAA